MHLHHLLPVKFVALLITVSLGTSLVAKDSPRVWSDATGSFSAEAEFIRVDVDKVVLKKTNGVTISVPIQLLSQNDREFLNSATANRHTVMKPAVTTPKFSSASFGNAKGLEKQTPQTSTDVWTLVKSLANESDEGKQAEILKNISVKWAKQPNPELEELFADCCSSESPLLRVVGLKAIAQNAVETGFDNIIEAIDDKEVTVRHSALEILSQVKDQRAVTPLLKRINSIDSKHVTAILINYGTSIEDQVIPLLHDSSESKRQIVCSILAKIGTNDSLTSLKRMILKEDSLRVRLYASDAIDTIQRRIKLNDLLSSR